MAREKIVFAFQFFNLRKIFFEENFFFDAAKVQMFLKAKMTNVGFLSKKNAMPRKVLTPMEFQNKFKCQFSSGTKM